MKTTTLPKTESDEPRPEKIKIKIQAEPETAKSIPPDTGMPNARRTSMTLEPGYKSKKLSKIGKHRTITSSDTQSHSSTGVDEEDAHLSNNIYGKSRSRSTDILDKLRAEFYERYDVTKPSSIEGLDQFERLKTLGSGSFGHVFLVHNKDNNNYYAMKVIDKTRIIKLKQVEHTLNEKKILQAVRFPFIVSVEYCFKDNSYIYFVMPFCNGGDMFTHLRRMQKFDEKLSKFYAAQVLLSLEFLHYCDILYRDLKPENILLDSKGYLKIVDLGFCKIVKGRTWTLCGTPEYIAPEIVLSKGYGKAVDWWSYGVLLFEMSAGYPPFTSNDPMKVYERITSCKYKCPPSFSMELTDIIRNLLQVDLSRRYGNLRNGVNDIRHHRWFHHVNFEAIYNRQVDPPFKPKVKSSYDTSNFDHFDETKLKIAETNLYPTEFEMF